MSTRSKRPPPLAAARTNVFVWAPSGALTIAMHDNAHNTQVQWTRHIASTSEYGFAGGVVYTADDPFEWDSNADLELQINDANWSISRQYIATSTSGQCEAQPNNQQARSCHHSTVIIFDKECDGRLLIRCVVVHPRQSPKAAYINGQTPCSTKGKDSRRFMDNDGFGNGINDNDSDYVEQLITRASTRALHRALGLLELHSPTGSTRTARYIGQGNVEHEGQTITVMQWIRLMRRATTQNSATTIPPPSPHVKAG